MPTHPTGDDPAFAELAHTRRGRLLRAIFETEPECVKLLGADGSLRLMNPAGLQMIEADSLDQVRGQCVYPLVAAEDRAAFQALVARVFRGESASLEFRMMGLKGTPRWLETRAVPFRSESGTVIAALGITRDITDQVLANAALRDSEKNFRMLFEQATDGIFVCDDELRFLDVNPAGCRITGYAREELQSLGVADLLDADELGRIGAEAGRLASGEIITTEWRARRRDGTPWIAEVTAKQLPDGRVQAFARDITERKRVEAQLLHAQKMETVGRLAGSIAHDFNNLLTIINGTADLALTGLRGDHPLREDLEQIRQAGERAATMTRQLLALSRRQILQPEILDLNAIVLHMQAMLRRAVGDDISLTFSLGEPVGHVKADSSQIEQVILNLVVHARDAMPDGGRLTIDTREAAAPPPAHWSMPPGPYVVLTVRDTGIALDDAALKRIFDPFVAWDTGKTGGLGLSMAYGIVKQSGGSMWIDSRAGEGTTFTIYLPRVEPTTPRPAAPLPGIEGHETVLIVDDEAAVRRLTKRVLESAGYRVVEAANAADALQLLERFTDPIQLMLTDVVMPGMNGRELAARVARLRPDMKVLYTTGYTEDSSLLRGVLDTTSRLLTKPFTSRDLRRKVREALDA